MLVSVACVAPDTMLIFLASAMAGHIMFMINTDTRDHAEEGGYVDVCGP